MSRVWAAATRFITPAFCLALVAGATPTRAFGAVNEIVRVDARAKDNPQYEPADIEGHFATAPTGMPDEIHVTNEGVKGKSAGVYNDPVFDGAILTIIQEAGPVIASVDGREGIGAIYWVSVTPGGGKGKGKVAQKPDLVADVGDVMLVLTLTDVLSDPVRSQADRTTLDTDTPMLLSSSKNGVGHVKFNLRVDPSHLPSEGYTWTISGGSAGISRELTAENNWQDSQDGLPPGSYQLVVLGGALRRRIDFVVFGLTINGDRIDQDEPTDTRLGFLPGVVYGGTEPSTADNVRLEAIPLAVPAGMDVQTYEWRVNAGGQGIFSPPAAGPNASAWNLGDIPVKAGRYHFSCVATLVPGVTAEATRPIEVGIRTDDYIVIGWINRLGVPLPAGGTLFVSTLFPPAGPPVADPTDANLYLFVLSRGSLEPLGVPLVPPDRTYMVNWLFRYADNPSPLGIIPLGHFRDAADTHIDYGKVAAYKLLLTRYKLFNHFQVRYRVDPATGRFNGAPVSLWGETAIGTTISPVAPITIGTIPISPTVFPGQAGPANGPPPELPAPGDLRISLINDGSPDAAGIRGLNTLSGSGVPVPVFWESIVSQIRFSVPDGATAKITVQPYPTYEVFRNGRHVQTISQAATPLGNFTANPYPFGTVPCGFPTPMITTQPGGRCGDAESPRDPSARLIPAVNP